MNTSPRRTRAAVALATIVAVAATSSAGVPGTASALDVPPPSITGFHEGVYVPIDDLLVGEQGDASVVANGDLAVTWAGSHFEGTVDSDELLESFDSDVGLRGAMTLELAATTGGDVGGTLELVSVPLTAFEVGPAVVTPYLGVNVRFSGHADAGAKVSVVAPFDASAAFSFDGAAQASSETRPRFLPEIGLPDAANALSFDVTVELELTMSFMVLIEGIFPVGGPMLVASLGAGLVVDPLDEVAWWRVDVLTGLKYGWAMPGLDGAPEPLDDPRSLFPVRRRTIASAGGPLPFAEVSTRWSWAFDIFHGDHAGAVLPVGNELLIAEDDANPWLTRLDGAGNPTWQQTGTQSSGSQAMARTDDGDVVVAGVSGSGDLGVRRVTANGRPEWSKHVDLTEATGAKWSAIVPTADGTIIAGHVRRTLTAVERPTLVSLDDTGELQWATEIDPGAGAGDATIVDVVETPAGDLLAVGTVSYELSDLSISQSNLLIVRLDRDGTATQSYVVGGRFGDVVTGVAVHADGSYAISGQTTVTVGVADYSWVASFDADNTLRWSSTYADRPDAGYAMATGIAAVGGGDYVVSGTTGMVGTDGWMIRIDGSGMPVWSKSYIGEDEEQLAGVVTMPHGVAAFGHTQTTDLAAEDGFYDLWLLRANVDGMVDFDPDSGFDTVNGAVQWSPTANHVQLQLEPANAPVTATVTDALSVVTATNATNSLLTN